MPPSRGNGYHINIVRGIETSVAAVTIRVRVRGRSYFLTAHQQMNIPRAMGVGAADRHVRRQLANRAQ